MESLSDTKEKATNFSVAFFLASIKAKGVKDSVCLVMMAGGLVRVDLSLLVVSSYAFSFSSPSSKLLDGASRLIFSKVKGWTKLSRWA